MRKTLIITGASSGIGRALAIELAKPGVTLCLLARRRDKLESLAKEVEIKGAESVVVPLDLTEQGRLKIFLDDQLKKTPVIDEVYHCAACSSFGPVEQFSAEDWYKLYKINILATADVIAVLYRQLAAQKQGRMVLVSSLAAYSGYPMATPYTAMKEGVLGLFQSLKHEAPYHGVKLHLAVPGFVDTGIYKKAIYRGCSETSTRASIQQLGFRMISSEQAASAICKGVNKGKKHIYFPFYVKFFSFIAPRFPFLIAPFYKKIFKGYHDAKVL